VAVTHDAEGQLEQLVSRYHSVVSPLRQVLRELHEDLQQVTDGTVADYIPSWPGPTLSGSVSAWSL
jgi:hypothetical protein